ncbi:MAG: hypothetical protein EA376_01700 [Phycisphaeraceae bacterium]|nr:MAG: hypothetical protein EA376_01700 [Phycisphaeraceae bacterium]
MRSTFYFARRTTLTAALTLAALALPAGAAQKLVATVADDDFDVPSTPVIRTINFNTTEPITGVGLTSLWTAVVADTQNGLWPWPIDMFIQVTAPDSQQYTWGPPIGGDRSFVEYPLQDGSPPAFNAAPGDGVYSFNVHSGAPAPYVIGLRNVEWHLTTTVPDVTFEWTGSTANDGTRPLWDRPFFIAGISGLGPVAYEVHEFTVSVSGRYSLLSVVPTGDNFTFLYQDGFDPEDQLENLLDTGLGNGNAVNGTPRGTSLIEAMLFEGRTYYFVNSQWSATQPGQPYTNTVTGPGPLSIGDLPCPADFTGDGLVGAGDLSILLGFWGVPGAPADLTGDNTVGSADLAILLGTWGPCP